jgi:hypothetical protein
MRKSLIAAMSAAAAIACLPAAASATSSATAPIEDHAGFCGVPQGNPIIGTTSFKRKGNLVKVTYKLTNGQPNKKFQLQLWAATGSPFSCENLGTLSEFKTNKHGKGTGKGSVVVPEADKEFFATSFEPTEGFYNDTTIVSLVP